MPANPSLTDPPAADRPDPVIGLTRWARPLLLIYWPALLLGTHWPRLAVPDVGPDELRLDVVIHLGAFGLLAWLLYQAAPMGRRLGPAANLGAAVVVASLYALFDEYSQIWFERVFDRVDVVANLAGVWCAAALAIVARPRPPAAADGSTSFVGSALLVGALTLASRLLGLVRDAALGAVFGVTGLTDAFWAGFVVPNLFRRLFGEGALTAAFVPVYTRLRHDDPAAARRLASLCALLLLLLLGTLVLVAEIVLGAIALGGAWSDRTLLALRLTMMMLPYTPLICLVALLGAVLQVHGRFGPPAAAPIVLNVVVILGAAYAATALDPGTTAAQRLMVVAVFVLIAGLCQLFWQMVAVRACESVTTDFTGTRPHLRAIGTTMLPMVVGLGVFQLNVLLDTLIAFFFSAPEGAAPLHLFGHSVRHPMAAGALTALQYAQRLYQFPLGVFGLALATAIFPALAHAAARRARAGNAENTGNADAGTEFRRTLQHGLRLAVFVALPASAGLVLVRLPLVRVLFEHGAFDRAASIRVAAILAGYAAAVWAYCLTHVLTRAFYALQDATTPLRISVAMVGLNLVLNLTLIWSLGAPGLAWSTACSAVCQVVLLLVAIRRHVAAPIGPDVRRSWARALLLTLVMAAVLAPIAASFDAAALSRTAVAGLLAGLTGSGVLVFGVGARLTRAPELSWLLRRRVG